MVGKYYEEIFFGKVGKNNSGLCILEEKDYAVFHKIHNKFNLPVSPNHSELGIGYEALQRYLKAGTLGKIPNEEVFLFNGVPGFVKDEKYSKIVMNSLTNKELKDLLWDAGLSNFEDKIKFI